MAVTALVGLHKQARIGNCNFQSGFVKGPGLSVVLHDLLWNAAAKGLRQ